MESPLKGKVLVATTALLDPNFAQAIVLIVQHDENGAMGLVLNRPLDTTVQEAWTQVSAVPYPNASPLFQGGPCEGPLMVVHRQEQRGQVELLKGLYLSSDADSVRALVTDDVAPLKFFVGYSGWSATQLEAELAEGSWHVAEVAVEDVLETSDDLWARLIRSSRPHMKPVVDQRFIPPDPSLN